MLITFLIPAYKRINGGLRTALSILDQCTPNCKGKVAVWINDDSSPLFDLSQAAQVLSPFGSVADILVTQNPSNLGMSKNILYMVSMTTSTFWTVVTDDDIMQPASLDSILKILSAAQELSVGAVLTPRYCYTEDGIFRFRGFDNDIQFPSILRKGAVNSLGYIKHAHVLTGLFIRSGLDLSAWRQYVENAYFPMINYASCILNHDCLAVDHNWFRHTIHNPTHWDEWGNTKEEQAWRTRLDYLSIFNFARAQAVQHCSRSYDRFLVDLVYLRHLHCIFVELLCKTRFFYVFRLARHSSHGSLSLESLLMLVFLLACIVVCVRNLMCAARRSLRIFYVLT